VKNWPLNVAYEVSFSHSYCCLTFRKYTTWDRRLYFPSESRTIIYLRIQSVPQREHRTSPKINWLTLFKEIIAVYSVNHTSSFLSSLSMRPCGTSRVVLHAVKSYDMGPSRFTSHPRGRCAADFYRP
jgi:hypothetical protein